MRLTRYSRDAALSAGEYQDQLSSNLMVVSNNSASSSAKHVATLMSTAVVSAGT